MVNFRTDLAIERRELLEKASSEEKLEGIEIEEKEINDRLKVSKIKITNENGEKAIGKPRGTYVTIDIKKLKIATLEDIEESANVLADELREVVNNHIDTTSDVLIVGLGNEYVTPDSLRTKSCFWNRNYKACY